MHGSVRATVVGCTPSSGVKSHVNAYYLGVNLLMTSQIFATSLNLRAPHVTPPDMVVTGVLGENCNTSCFQGCGITLRTQAVLDGA